MQGRFQRLEDQFTVLVANVATIKSNYATKQDLDAVKAEVLVIKANYATKQDVDAVKADIAVIKANYATREDMQAMNVDFGKQLMAQTKWVVATQFITLGAGLSLAKFLF